MKNTLLAVLVTTVCYDHILAQPITPQVFNNAVTPGRSTDGAASTDKLASDIVTTNKLVDGVLTLNKLADDIINSQTLIDDVAMPERQGTTPTTSLTQYNTIGEQWSYARYGQPLLLPIQQVKKPRPLTRKGPAKINKG